jgi:hypothetical protein
LAFIKFQTVSPNPHMQIFIETLQEFQDYINNNKNIQYEEIRWLSHYNSPITLLSCCLVNIANSKLNELKKQIKR